MPGLYANEGQLVKLIKTFTDISIIPVIVGICKTESSLDIMAFRFEPGFYKQYKDKITPQLDALAASASYGLMQIMGQTARELGFSGDFSRLFIPSINLEYGIKYFRKQLKRYDGDIDAALAAYNAGSARKDPDGTYKNSYYITKVKKNMPTIEEVTRLLE